MALIPFDFLALADQIAELVASLEAFRSDKGYSIQRRVRGGCRRIKKSLPPDEIELIDAPQETRERLYGIQRRLFYSDDIVFSWHNDESELQDAIDWLNNVRDWLAVECGTRKNYKTPPCPKCGQKQITKPRRDRGKRTNTCTKCHHVSELAM